MSWLSVILLCSNTRNDYIWSVDIPGRPIDYIVIGIRGKTKVLVSKTGSSADCSTDHHKKN